MIKFGVKLKVNEFLRVKRGLKNQGLILKSEEDKLPYRQAVGFKDLVRNTILSGSLGHPAYDPWYEKYKLKTIGHLKLWRLFGSAIRSLTVFKHGNDKGWHAGIPANAQAIGHLMPGMGGRKSKQIAMYLRTLEYGSYPQKSRPVFAPLTIKYRYSDFPREALLTLQKLRSSWR